MRRWSLGVWLFRVVLPAIVAYWSDRATRALGRWIAGATNEPRGDDPRATLLWVLNQSQLVSMLLTLLIVVEVCRILLSLR